MNCCDPETKRRTWRVRITLLVLVAVVVMVAALVSR